MISYVSTSRTSLRVIFVTIWGLDFSGRLCDSRGVK
jgi:hypothetical protein